jgi:dihydrofolate reductase
MITLIAAIGKNNEIGYNNELLWKIPEDMKHFRNYTTGKVVIMGRKTFQSIGKVLPGRKCIVISTQEPDNRAVYAKSIADALSIDHCYKEIVIIGGASIYEQTIDLANKLVITHVESSFCADSYFPEINLNKWKISSSVDSKNEHYNYKFVEYDRF